MDSSALEFADFLSTVMESGALTEDQLDDENVFDVLKGEYQKSFQDKSLGRIKKASIDGLDSEGISTISGLQGALQDESSRAVQADNDNLIANELTARQQDYLDFIAKHAKDRDNAIEFSTDQAQKSFGEGVATLGDALGTSDSFVDNAVGKILRDVGSNIVKQQDKDIEAGGYESTYKGGIFDQSNPLALGGWVIEKALESSVSGGAALIGLGAAALTAPVSGAAATAIVGTTTATSGLMAIGDVAEELKEKGVYDSENSGKAVAVGLMSAAVDMLGAGRAIPKDAIIKELLENGTVDKVANDLVVSGALNAAKTEGLTEVLQEGITMAHAADEGAEYDTKEVLNRITGAAVVGATLGAGYSGSTSAIASAARKLRQNGEAPNINNIPQQVAEDEVTRDTAKGDFGGGEIVGLTPSQAASFAGTTAQTESNNDLSVINQYGYSGKYQFGAGALADIGLIDLAKYKASGKGVKSGTSGQQEFLEDPSNWTIDGGLETFLSSKQLQDDAFVDLANLNIKRGLKSGALSEDSSPAEIAGYAKAAHLVGAGNANKFVLSGADKRDGNGTAASTYYQQGFDSINGTSPNRQSRVIRKDGENQEITYDVVEASSIPDSDAEPTATTQSIESNIDYEGLSGSSTSSFGSPVVDAQENVIDGNSRLQGILNAYKSGNAEQYRQGLLNEAGDLGIDQVKAAEMQQPVLIRRLNGVIQPEEVDPEVAATEVQANETDVQPQEIPEDTATQDPDIQAEVEPEETPVENSGELVATEDGGDDGVNFGEPVLEGEVLGPDTAPRIIEDDTETNFGEGDTRTSAEAIIDTIKNAADFLKKKVEQPTSLFGSDAVQAGEVLSATNKSSDYQVSAITEEFSEVMDNIFKNSGGKPIQDEYDRVYQYMKTSDPEEKAALDLTPRQVAVAEKMRAVIDDRSGKFMDLIVTGLAQELDANIDVTVEQFTSDEFLAGFNRAVRNGEIDDVKASRIRSAIKNTRTIKENIGSYVTTTYKAHTHPKEWQDLVLNSQEPEYVKIRKDVESEFMGEARDENPDATIDELVKIAENKMQQFVISTDPNREDVLLSRSVRLSKSKPLRRLLGEHTDPDAAFANSVHRMNRTLASKEFMAEMSAVAESEGWNITTQDQRTEGMRRINVSKGGIVRNPFYDLWAEPSHADFIERMTGDRDNGKAMKFLMGVNGLWQAAQTVASIPGGGANILSGVTVMASTATFSTTGALDTISTINHVFRNTKPSKEKSERFKQQYGFDIDEMRKFAVDNQLTSGGALGGSFELFVKEGGLDAIIRGGGRALGKVTGDVDIEGVGKFNAQGAANATADGIAKATRAGQAFYDIGDSLPKLTAFFHYVEFLQDLRTSSGDRMIAEGDILKAAANIAKNISPQYSRIFQAADFARRNPLAGQFVAFQAQMIQTTYNQARLNMALINPEKNAAYLKDVMKVNVNWIDDQRKETRARRKDPNAPDVPRLEGARDERVKQEGLKRLKERGYKAMLGQIGTLTMWPTVIGATAAALLGDGDDISDEEDAAVSELMPEYYKLIDKQYQGKDENGNYKFINTSRINMYGGVTDSLKHITDYASGKTDLGEAAWNFTSSVFQPFVDWTFTSRTIADLSRNETQYGKKIWINEDGFITNVGALAKHMGEQFYINGTSKGLIEIAKDLDTENLINEKTGSEYGVGNALQSFAGAAPITFDPKRQALFWMYRGGGESRELKSRLTGRLKSFNNIDTEDIRALVSNARDEHVEINKTMLKKIAAARALGVSDEDILKAGKIARTSGIKFLMDGVIPPFNLDNSGKGSISATNFKNLSESTKATFSKNYEEARRIANSLPLVDG